MLSQQYLVPCTRSMYSIESCHAMVLHSHRILQYTIPYRQLFTNHDINVWHLAYCSFPKCFVPQLHTCVILQQLGEHVGGPDI